MGFLRKIVSKGTLGLISDGKKKRAAPAQDPDPINPLTGRPMSQNVPMTGMGGMPAPQMQPAMMQGLGQMPQSYMPAPVAMSQAVPQGLGSDVFRSTLAPLQQQGYGLGQIDPRLLTGIVRFPGGMIQ